MNNNIGKNIKDLYTEKSIPKTTQRDPDTYKLIGIAMEVHNTIGCGFLEAVYQEALEIELLNNLIPYEREKKLNIFYKDQKMKTYYKADFICYDKIIVELKSVKELSNIDEAQVLNYLKASGLHKALLINFGSNKLQFKRFVYS